MRMMILVIVSTLVLQIVIGCNRILPVSPTSPPSSPISVSAQLENWNYDSRSVSFYCPISKSYYTQQYSRYYAQIELTSLQASVSLAGITITGPGGAIPVTFADINNMGTTGHPSYVAQFFSERNISLPYKAGGTYVLNIKTPTTSISASVVGPGNISVASDGSKASWAVEGNNDNVGVAPWNGKWSYETSGADVDSPICVPTSAYPSPGSYCVYVNCENMTNFISNGVGEFDVFDYAQMGVSK